jgi:hypothetical protein
MGESDEASVFNVRIFWHIDYGSVIDFVVEEIERTIVFCNNSLYMADRVPLQSIPVVKLTSKLQFSACGELPS